jgi:hypothetical protein
MAPRGAFTLTGTGAGTSGQTFAGQYGQWAARTRGRMRAVMQASAFAFAEAVIVGNRWSTGTPVDTGYARASWVASLGLRSTALPVGPRPTRAEVRRYAADLGRIAAIIGQWGPGQTLWLANNTGYLGYLEFGLTVPLNGATPPGWIGQAERQWRPIVAEETRKLRAAVRGGARV